MRSFINILVCIDNAFITGTKSYLSHLLYYGYDNELPFDGSRQEKIVNRYRVKEQKSSDDRASHSREIKTKNIVLENNVNNDRQGK